MNTRLRLLAILLTCGALFTLSWYFFVRERPQQVLPPKQKTTEELLIGIWEIVEHNPPIAPDLKATVEYTKDGKKIIRATHFRDGPVPPQIGVYQLQGETIRCDYPEDGDHPYQTWIAKIETITDDTLILVSSGEGTKRVVYQRVREK